MVQDKVKLSMRQKRKKTGTLRLAPGSLTGEDTVSISDGSHKRLLKARQTGSGVDIVLEPTKAAADEAKDKSMARDFNKAGPPVRESRSPDLDNQIGGRYGYLPERRGGGPFAAAMAAQIAPMIVNEGFKLLGGLFGRGFDYNLRRAEQEGGQLGSGPFAAALAMQIAPLLVNQGFKTLGSLFGRGQGGGQAGGASGFMMPSHSNDPELAGDQALATFLVANLLGDSGVTYDPSKARSLLASVMPHSKESDVAEMVKAAEAVLKRLGLQGMGQQGGRLSFGSSEAEQRGGFLAAMLGAQIAIPMLMNMLGRGQKGGVFSLPALLLGIGRGQSGVGVARSGIMGSYTPRYFLGSGAMRRRAPRRHLGAGASRLGVMGSYMPRYRLGAGQVGGGRGQVGGAIQRQGF